jgi:hypothetical protein
MSRMFLPNTHTQHEEQQPSLDELDMDHGGGRSSYQLMLRAGLIRQVGKKFSDEKSLPTA